MMEIVFHAHRAVISEAMRTRAERVVRRLARRVERPTQATVRFAEDGPARRVEIELRASNRRQPLVASAAAPYFGPALSNAAQRLENQADRLKQVRDRKHAAARSRAPLPS